jgi:hypothetical protein
MFSNYCIAQLTLDSLVGNMSSDFIILHAILRKQERKKKKRSLRLCRKAILDKKKSAHNHLHEQARIDSKSAESFEKIFRFDPETFDLILSRFKPVYDKIPLAKNVPKSRPRRRLFQATDVLKLILRGFAGNENFDTLAMLSGGCPETVSRTFHHGMHVLLAVLEKWSISRMSFPTVEEAEHLVGLGKAYLERHGYHGTRGNFIGFLDGSIRLRERPDDDAWQEENRNGKSKTHAIKILLVQLLDGCFAPSAVNFLGTSHDSKIMKSLKLDRLMAHLPPDFILAGDTAFGSTSRIIRPLSETETSGISVHERSLVSSAASLLSCLRIGSEWSVGGPLQCFPLLNSPVPADDLDCGSLRWQLCLRLFNLRVRIMGIGQTHKVFAAPNSSFFKW